MFVRGYPQGIALDVRGCVMPAMNKKRVARRRWLRADRPCVTS